MTDSCVSPSQQLFSYIRQEQVTFNDVMVVICFALEKHTKLNIVVVSHWSNNPQVEMSIQFGHWSKDTGNEDKQNYKKPITHKVKKMNNTTHTPRCPRRVRRSYYTIWLSELGFYICHWLRFEILTLSEFGVNEIDNPVLGWTLWIKIWS